MDGIVKAARRYLLARTAVAALWGGAVVVAPLLVVGSGGAGEVKISWDFAGGERERG